MGDGMHGKIAQIDALVCASIYWIDAGKMFEQPERRSGLPNPWGGMIASDEYNRNICLGETYQLLQSETERTVGWPHCIKEIATVQNCIRTKLENLVHECLERAVSIYLSLIQAFERAILVAYLAIGRVA